MKKNKNVLKDYIFIAVGIVLVATGFYLHKNIISTDKTITAIPYIFVAFGCGILGHFIGNVVRHISIKDYDDWERQIKIDKNDERNILISDKAKAKAYDLMIYLFAAMLIIFSLMAIDKFVVISIAAIYITLHIYALYWRSKFENNM
ncbi:hypothetical protein [Johnsonella ignava]|uniref:hypothetical protein n=1 Tax=Johnsonella ignava TaxID=43995 RepID=UPI0023F1E4A6|nr:hypothetical protein [Johnsonella ignava]